MSRFLKVIVALILIVFIGAGAALIIPPFLGVDTVVVQDGMDSDLRTGTTVFAKAKPVDQLSVGTKILSQENNSVYIRRVQEVDPSSGLAVTDDGGLLAFSSTFKKAYLAIPFIGYLSIATQSRQGLIILLLILAATVILFIVSEILRRSREEEDEGEEDEDDNFYGELAEKKRRRERSGEITTLEESASRATKTEPETPAEGAEFRDIFGEQGTVSLDGQEIPQEPFVEDAEDATAFLNPEMIAGASAADEASSQEGTGQEADEQGLPEQMQLEIDLSEIEEESTGELSEPAHSVSDESLPDVQAALEAALENQQLNRTEAIHLPPEVETAPEPELPLEEIELAMPVYTADELMQKAYSEGKDPTIIQDETTGITLVDFSDCI